MQTNKPYKRCVSSDDEDLDATEEEQDAFEELCERVVGLVEKVDGILEKLSLFVSLISQIKHLSHLSTTMK